MYTQWKIPKSLLTLSDYTEPSSGSNDITSTSYNVSTEDKLNTVFNTISCHGWMLTDFLHMLFTPFQKNNSISTSIEIKAMQNRHCQFVHKSLSGSSCYMALDIITRGVADAEHSSMIPRVAHGYGTGQ